MLLFSLRLAAITIALSAAWRNAGRSGTSLIATASEEPTAPTLAEKLTMSRLLLGVGLLGVAFLAVVRWDADGGKTIRPIARHADGWRIGAMPEPRPLYALPRLADGSRIYVVEGEKCADAARGIGLVATTSTGGACGGGGDHRLMAQTSSEVTTRRWAAA